MGEPPEPAEADGPGRLFALPPEPARQPAAPSGAEPLASRMRPRTLAEYVGHAEVLGPGSPLRLIIEAGDLASIILWGPPGSGKTSLAQVVAAHVDGAWTELSAVSAGVQDVRRVIAEARERLVAGRRTVLFLDEIHRFNKSQQDALLPAVEAGWLTLIGATTENPFFELNAPLMSRCRLVRLESLTREDLRVILARALADAERGYAGRYAVADRALDALVLVGDGDARAALNALELAVKTLPGDRGDITEEIVGDAMRQLRFDNADDHFDQVSAFIKSVRGSDPDAGLYWLLRMLRSGEDPLYLARRLVILASEDIGLAEPTALPTALAAYQAVERIGLPEGEHALVHATIALAMAPKSNAVARALAAGRAAVDQAGNQPVPLHLRDGHSRAGRALGHGRTYDYPHDHPGAWVPQAYLPEELTDLQLYEPTTHGAEAPVAERLAELRALQRGEPLRDAPTTPRPAAEGNRP